MALNPMESTNILTGGVDGNLESWQLDSGQSYGILEGHEDPVTCCGYHPNGSAIFSGSEDSTVRIWGMPGRKKLILESTDY